MAFADTPESPLFEPAKQATDDRNWMRLVLVVLAAVAIAFASLWCLTAMGVWYY